jgi:hypothetical protein
MELKKKDYRKYNKIRLKKFFYVGIKDGVSAGTCIIASSDSPSALVFALNFIIIFFVFEYIFLSFIFY